jgi:hypothetical protein
MKPVLSSGSGDSMLRLTAVAKIVVLWLVGALDITIPIYRLNMPHYQRLTRGVRGIGVVTALEPGNHQTVLYKFDAGGKTYSGAGRAGFGNPGFGGLSVGQSVIIYYDSDDPNESCVGIPAELIKNEIPPILGAGITFPHSHWRYGRSVTRGSNVGS